MNPVLVLALLIVAGLAATRLPRVTPRQVNLRFVHAAGTPLLLLGMLLGPGSGVLDDSVMRALAPVMALAVPQLRSAWRPLVPVAFALAAIAAVSGPGAVKLAARTGGVRHAVARKLGTAATIDTAYGVLAFTLALAIGQPRGPIGAGPLGASAWLLLALGSGVLVGILFLGLARLREAQDVGIATLGAVLFGAAVGYAADLSPFLVCAIAGAVIGNYSPERRAVVAQLQAWDFPLYVVFLVMLGALLGLQTLWVVPAALLLAALRIAARWVAGRFGRLLAGATGLPPDVGLAGVAQGSVALALGINFLLIYQGAGGPAPDAVLTTVVLGVVLAQLAAPLFMSRALRSPELTASPAPAEVS